MFHQYGRSRPNQSAQQAVPGVSPTRPNPSAAQYKPDFLHSSTTPPAGTPAVRPMQRVQPDNFDMLGPQRQREALYDQARQQAARQQPRDYQRTASLKNALPGGLSERQRNEFQMLARSNPAAAEQQLQQYRLTADIRYNKPSPTSQQNTMRPHPPQPPIRFNGPRGRFGV